MNKLNKLKPYIINIIIVLTIILIALFINNIYPFGPNLIDGIGSIEFKPILYNYITSIKEGILSSYNPITGLGIPSLHTYIYYLASPINLLALPANNPDSMFLIIFITKLIITAITSTFYFKSKTNNNKLTTILVLAYTFQSYLLTYYFKLMWLDTFMMLPLLQYGLESLLTKKKKLTYILTLTYLIITNIYMIPYILIYITIYSIIYTIKTKNNNLNQLILTTILTLLLNTLTIYLTYNSLINIGIFIENKNEYPYYITLLNNIKSLFYGNNNINLNSYNTSFPNISLSILFLISFIYYFLNKDIKLKEKILTTILVLISFLTFNLKELNMILNLFHIPNGFNYRYSFLFTFFIILIFIRNYKTFHNKINFKVYIINAILLILLIIELIYNDLSFTNFIFNLVFLLSYTILFILYTNKDHYKYLILTVFILEIVTCTTMNINNEYKEIDYNSFTTTQDLNRHSIPIKIDNEINNNLYSNTNKIESYNSVNYHNEIVFLDNMGCLTDSKKHIISCSNNPILEMVLNANKEYPLPKLFGVSNSIYLIDTDDIDPINNLNNMIKGMTNIDNVIVKTELDEINKNTYKYKITNPNTYYINVSPNMNYIKINDVIYDKDNNLLTNRYLKITPKLNDIIEINYLNKPKVNKLTLYNNDKTKLDKAYSILKNNEIKYDTYESNYIKGTIKLDSKEVIFTSIPYDTNWRITVDNKEVKPIRLYNTFIGIEIPEGIHEISLNYKHSLLIPSIISLGTGCFLLYLIKKGKII